MAALPNLRRGIGNRVTTSLSASVTDVALTMTVSDATGMNADGGYIMIDEEYSNKREIVYVESITSNTLTISTSGRGLAGTTAVSHDSGATVTDIVVDENVNGIIDMFSVGHTDAGAHVLPNNTGLSIKESGGTAREIVKVTSGNIVTVGYNTLPIQTNGKWDGWNAIGDTWTYASATTITVPAGAATYYAVGDKIKLTQTTAKYFYVVAVADELLTVTGGTDYTVANAAITDIYVSKMQSPVGFPSHFNYTPTETGWSSNTIRKGWFLLNGRQCVVTVRLAGTSDTTSVAVGLPITAATITDMIWGGAAEYGANNNIDLTGAIRYYVLSGGTTVVFHTNMASGAWTASSFKEVRATVSYLI